MSIDETILPIYNKHLKLIMQTLRIRLFRSLILRFIVLKYGYLVDKI